MGYKVIDYEGETMKSGFSTPGSAWNWIHSSFTPAFITDMNIHVVKEEDNND